MVSDLKQSADSELIEAMNLMRPRSAKSVVVVYVEGLDDIAFWAECFRPYTDRFIFEIDILRKADGTLVCGKSELLDNIDVNVLGRSLLVAVDADYDWIIPDYRPSRTHESLSPLVCGNPYVLHTYLYSIENYKSHADCVARYIDKTTCCCLDDVCHKFFADFSIAVSDLFLTHLVSMDKCDGKYTISMFKQDIADVRYDFDKKCILPASVERLKKILEQKKTYREQYAREIKHYESDLLHRGFKRDSYYLLFQGHTLADAVTRRILNRIVWKLRSEKLNILRGHPDATEREKHIKHYCKITGISESNRHDEINERIGRLILDCTEIRSISEGYPLIKADLDRLFAVEARK